MTDEPYRWLEAVANRREYVQNQIKDGSPVIAVSLDDGILLVGVGMGQSKVFEIFDRHALAGLGHPADMERVRQGLIDAAHLEGFARSPADVSLRRLVSFNLGPQLKTAFEQVYAPPFLVRLLLAELGPEPERDVLLKVHFDGTFTVASGRCAVLAADPALEAEVESSLSREIGRTATVADAGPLVLAACRELARVPASKNAEHPAADAPPAEPAAPISRPVVEAALLRRDSPRTARYEPVALEAPSPGRQP